MLPGFDTLSGATSGAAMVKSPFEQGELSSIPSKASTIAGEAPHESSMLSSTIGEVFMEKGKALCEASALSSVASEVPVKKGESIPSLDSEAAGGRKDL